MKVDDHLAEETTGQAHHRIMASTAQRGRLPMPIWISTPLQNGSILEALILTHMQEVEDGQSTATSWMVMCRAMEKLFKLGTVKSEARRNCKLRGTQETKVTKGTCCPEHRMIWNVQVQRFPNNQHKMVSDR